MKYLGIDWATRMHHIALVDEQGQTLYEGRVNHTPEGVAEMLALLKEHGGPPEVAVAIESGAPSVLLAEIQQAGYRLHAVNPLQSERFRERGGVSGAKDDARDALALARALRTDHDRMPVLKPTDEQTVELRLRDRARTRAIEHRVAVSNQLTDTLRQFFPAMLNLQRPADDPLLLDLLEAFPTPTKARTARLSRVQRILAAYQLRKLTPEKVLEVLQAPAFRNFQGAEEAFRDEVLQLVAHLRLLNQQIDGAEKVAEETFKSHPDRELLESLPGLGKRLTIRVAAHLGEFRGEPLQASTLRVHAGTAPVTVATGKWRDRNGKLRDGTRVVRMRRACDHDLHQALFAMARASIRTSRWARAYYGWKRKNGSDHAPTVRQLADKWAKILAAVLRTRKPYDEDLHTRSLLRAAGAPWAKDLASAA